MQIINRVKNILVSPKTEWEVIYTETDTPVSLLKTYVMPLAVFASLGTLISFFLAGGRVYTTLNFAIGTFVITIISQVISFYLTTLIVDMLGPSFSSERNMNKSAQLVAYSSTPSYISAFLNFIPFVGMLLSLVAFGYSIYIMYLGIGPMKETPEDKKIVYLIVSFVIMIAIYFILIAILGGILFAMLGGAALLNNSIIR